MCARAIVSLGSNIEPRRDYLEKALDALGRLDATSLVASSRILETEPVDVPEAFARLKFLNQIAIFETSLEVHDFARRMHAIEDTLGRVRTVRNGPRTIDIDLIDFDGMHLNEPELVLPHPRAAARAFVTEPLAELGLDCPSLVPSPHEAHTLTPRGSYPDPTGLVPSGSGARRVAV